MNASLPALVMIGFTLFGPSRAVYADPPIVITEPTAGFSYTIPSGWRAEKDPGDKTATASSDHEPDFTPNIVEADVRSSMSLSDFAKANIHSMQKDFPQFKTVSQTEFETDSHIKGIRLVAEATLHNHKLRDIFYFFPGKGNLKYILTLSAYATAKDKFDAPVDGAMRTFKLL